jgi:RHS repeat-associated protein
MIDNSAAITAAVLPVPGTPVSYATTTSYDRLNRPVNVSFSPAPASTAPAAGSVTFAHAYNAANQRVGQTATDNSWWFYPPASASTVGYASNAANQYTTVGTVTPTYNANGSPIFDGTFTYGYDAENRLTSATATGNVNSYAYDAQGRRKTRTVNGTTTVTVTDADNRAVLEYDGSSGALLRWYAHGAGPNDVLSQVSLGGSRAAMVPDIQGSVLATLDSGTGAFARQNYLPYGKSASASITGTFGYTGQRIDPESGLYYYRARMYHTAWGRFLQPDPLGTITADLQPGPGGTGNRANLYVYVSNDPLNMIDPLGLYTLQLGGNFGFTTPFGISGVYYFGIAFDTQGGAAGYYGGGLGVGLGAGASMSGSVAVSTAQTVKNLGGVFSNASIGIGAGGRAGLDTFFGPSDNGLVSGVGLSAGVGLGGTSFAGPTNTVIMQQGK